MKTLLKIAGVIAVLAAVFVFIGGTTAFAQRQGNSPAPVGGSQVQSNPDAGLGMNLVNEAAMHAAIAEALGISVEELEASLDAGKTPATLALELGVDFAKVRAAMDTIHEAAIQQAVVDGLITQEQADWILNHRGGQNGQQGHGGNGGRMGGQAQRRAGGSGGFNGECPYPTP